MPIVRGLTPDAEIRPSEMAADILSEVRVEVASMPTLFYCLSEYNEKV